MLVVGSFVTVILAVLLALLGWLMRRPVWNFRALAAVVLLLSSYMPLTVSGVAVVIVGVLITLARATWARDVS